MSYFKPDWNSQNSISAGALPQTPLGELTALPRPPSSIYKNSSGDEIANVNFYAVRPWATGIRWNNAK